MVGSQDEIPRPLQEIYRIILQKGFIPELWKHKDPNACDVLVLNHPTKKYHTSYKMVDGKFKYKSGVDPYRILR